MPATKRKANEPTDVATSKRSRTASSEEDEGNMDATDLRELDKDVLVGMVLGYQSRIQRMQQDLDTTNRALKDTSSNINACANLNWTQENIAERAEKLREMCAKEIKKRIKWQPTCEKGTTKWSNTAIVPNQDVFRAVMGEEKNAKAWKMKKVPVREFKEMFGDISAFCRYNNLSITGENVNVRWNPEELTFQHSGTYGI